MVCNCDLSDAAAGMLGLGHCLKYMLRVNTTDLKGLCGRVLTQGNVSGLLAAISLTPSTTPAIYNFRLAFRF